ncbi:MAG: GTPase Era [Candidatus Acidiferrales bacterium]
MTFNSGFVAIVGRPNAGKSTLVNTAVGRKVAIVSPRPQTTRNRIQGILNREDAQIVMVDTPGIHKPDNVLSHQMMGETEQALDDVDIVSLIVDVTAEFGAGDRYSAKWLRRFRGPVFLLLNKVDRVKKAILLPLIDRWRREFEFAEIFPISALTGEGCADLVKAWIAKLPEAPAHFPDDQFTDQPERFLASEMIREQALRVTREEVPHAIAVFVDRFEHKSDLIKIMATIYVEREGQKGILIGKRGETIKTVGTHARKEIESMLGTHVFLELMVKVQPNWRRNRSIVRQLDWHRQLEQMSAGQELDEAEIEEAPEVEPES